MVRRRELERRRVKIVAWVLLAGVTVLWAAPRVVEAGRYWTMDPADRALSGQLKENREDLHDRIGEVRSRHPGSSGQRALTELEEAGGKFRLLAVDEDGRTSAEVVLSATATEGWFAPTTWNTRVCLEVWLEPESRSRRGTVTTEQTTCSESALSTDQRSSLDRAPAITLGRLRTTVPEPTTPPPPVCYSGSYCEEDANPSGS